jgi:hypothetical protein
MPWDCQAPKRRFFARKVMAISLLACSYGDRRFFVQEALPKTQFI